jgi:hypothetical protein
MKNQNVKSLILFIVLSLLFPTLQAQNEGSFVDMDIPTYRVFDTQNFGFTADNFALSPFSKNKLWDFKDKKEFDFKTQSITRLFDIFEIPKTEIQKPYTGFTQVYIIDNFTPNFHWLTLGKNLIRLSKEKGKFDRLELPFYPEFTKVGKNVLLISYKLSDLDGPTVQNLGYFLVEKQSLNLQKISEKIKELNQPIDIPELLSENRLRIGSNMEMNIETGEVTGKPTKSEELSFYPLISTDIAWKDYQFLHSNYGNNGKQIIVKKNDLIVDSIFTNSFRIPNYSFNYPNVWISDKVKGIENIDFRLIKKYNVETQKTEEKLFLLTNRFDVVKHDKRYIWYKSDENLIYFFDKKDNNVWKIENTVLKNAKLFESDEQYLYFTIETSLNGKVDILIINKKWLFENKMEYPFKKKTEEYSQFLHFADSVHISLPNNGIEKGLLTIDFVHKNYGNLGNSLITKRFAELEELFYKECQISDALVVEAESLFDKKSTIMPLKLVLPMYEKIMDKAEQKADTEKYLRYWGKMKAVKSDYFVEKYMDQGLCVAKQLALFSELEKLKKTDISEEDFLLEKAKRIKEASKDFCHAIFEAREIVIPNEMPTPAIYTYAEIAQKYPKNKRINQLSCELFKIIDSDREFELSVFESLNMLTESPCIKDFQKKYFYRLVDDYSERRPDSLKKALNLGEKLLNNIETEDEKGAFTNSLEEIKNELNSTETKD